MILTLISTVMPKTYHKIFIQAVFAVKYRQGLIQPDWENSLYAVIGNSINRKGGKSFIVNGAEDHVHCFFAIPPSVCVSNIMKAAKGRSSKWLNDSKLLTHRFEWQVAYGCFSYGQSQKHQVYQYILNQKKHHQKISFRDEYIGLLQKFEIDYDENDLFKDPIDIWDDIDQTQA